MVDLSKTRSLAFETLAGHLRQQSQIRRAERKARRGRNGLYRLFAEREYELTFDRGEVLEHRLTGFGFETAARGSFFVRCARTDRPPEEQQVLAAICRITRKQFRPVEKPRYHLLGYLTESGELHYAARSWRGLHGRFTLPALCIVALMIASTVWFLWDTPPPHIVDPAWSFRLIVWFIVNCFLIVLFFTKLSQRIRARRDFRQHVAQLEPLADTLR